MAYRNFNNRGGNRRSSNGGGKRQEMKDMSGKLFLSDFFGKNKRKPGPVLYGVIKIDGVEYKLSAFLNVGFKQRDDRDAQDNCTASAQDIAEIMADGKEDGIHFGLTVQENDGQSSGGGNRRRSRRDDDEDEEEDRRPSRGRRSRRDEDEDEPEDDNSKPWNEDEDEPEEEGEEDEAEDDEPAKPVKSRSRKPAAKKPAAKKARATKK